MAVQIGSLGQPGFDTPFALMSDCHRRIEHFLGIFQRVVDRYASIPLDDEARGALLAANRYFRESAPNHTADEEDSLFPRLRSLDREDLGALLLEAERLEREHDQAELIHSKVEERVYQWLVAGTISNHEIEQLRQELDSLQALYARHILFEDSILFPRAAKVLSGSDIKDIGSEMATRRVVGG
tara:strand:+ start:136309 stop:136860 length:552 start_codon:yes stop_codon:yes gene_type:complete